MKPFLRWVGGKSVLLPHIKELWPKKFKHYYEPFFGGGAIFFAMHKQIKNGAVLSDYNEDLMKMYLAVSRHPFKVHSSLTVLKNMHSEKLYYAIRERFNEKKDHVIVRSAMFIYLNAKGFRGLCRYNKKGEFNVPIHRPNHMKRPCPTIEQLKSAFTALKFASLSASDYTDILAYTERDDFVVLDPPYIPLNDTSYFTSYTENGFDIADQMRLAMVCKTMNLAGVKFMAFNNNVPKIYELYKGFNIYKVEVKRGVGVKKGQKAKPIYELIITNYEE